MPDDSQRVDPRYDPAFQRGFDGPVTTARRRSAPARVDEPAPSRLEPVAESVPEDTHDETHDYLDPAPAAPTRRLTRNPYLIVLVILGAALTTGGIAWANQARMLVSVRGGAATDLDYWFLQSSAVAAPLTILAGVGILAGVLFIAATAWNRRP